ncbi:lantibiotic dehydratase [Streptomyces sp. KR80]|uniref:lantibiotic dehydratase n=1 Tax=Streptomyces sp. KR80 TaxID=3457426 RepID=UPI003FD07774
MRELKESGTSMAPTERRPEAAAAEDAEVFSPLVVRRCGIGVRELGVLEAPQTGAALRAAEQETAAADALAEELVEGLHRAVPLLDREPRRVALRVKRKIFNGVADARTAQDIRRLTSWAPAALTSELQKWQHRQEALRERMAIAERGLLQETRACGKALLDSWAAPDRSAALALASPVLADRLLSGAAARPGPEGRTARSLTSYLARATLKTSPFGDLTTVGLAWTDASDLRAAPPGGPKSPVRSARLSRPVAVLALYALAAHPATAPAFAAPRPGPVHTTRFGPLAVVRTARYGHLVQVDFALTDVRRHLDLLSGPEAPQRLEDWARLDPGGLRRLLELGLAVLPAPWDASHDAVPFGALAEVLESLGEPAALEPCRQLAALERDYATLGAAQRVAADRRTRIWVKDVLESAGAPAPGWLATAALWHEAVQTPGEDLLLPRSVREDLARAVAAQAGAGIVLNPLYSGLVAAFRRTYGTGGRCTGVMEFLAEFLRHPRTAHEAESPSPAASPRPGPVGGHGTVAPPIALVYAQIAADSAAHMADGDYRLVVNQLHTGGLGVLARWHRLGRPGLLITERLPRWLAAASPGCRLLQLPMGGELTETQHVSSALLPAVHWYGQQRGSGALPIDALRLHHDPGTDTLQLTDAAGTPVVLHYLAVAIPAHMSPLSRLLLLLSDPWLMPMLLPHQPPPAPARTGPVTHVPRTEYGRVVLRRAEWHIDGGAVPRPTAGQQLTARHLLQLRRWFTAHGIPVEGFIRPYTDNGAVGHDAKPAWFSLEHPHTVTAALLPALAAPRVRIAEALPSRAQHWVRGPDGEPYATELTALVRCPQGPGRAVGRHA